MTFKARIAYAYAILMIPLALITFICSSPLSHQLVETTGIQVSPWYTGGEIIKITNHGKYQTLLHRPVFDGLIYPEKKGFIQIDWSPSTQLPHQIAEDIDYDQDGIIDFHLEYNTTNNTVKLIPYNKNILSLQGPYVLIERNAIRIELSNN